MSDNGLIDCGIDVVDDGWLSGCGVCGTEEGDGSAGTEGNGTEVKEGGAAALEEEIDAVVPEIEGSGRVDLATGAVRLSLAPPASTPYDPRQELTYNSRNTTTGENGCGVTGSLNVKIIEIDSNNVDFVNGLGEKIRFRRDSLLTNIYRSPPGSTSKLEKIATDGTWQQTNYDGSIVRYDATGKISALTDPRGNRSTVSYDAGGRVTGVLNPYGRRITCAYDASNKLKSIQDAGGRVTTFTVDGNGNLTQFTTPELCIIELKYDVSNRLQTYIDPLGYRTTYAYDANGLVSSMKVPTGDITTISWLDWNTTKIQDANGKITTLQYNAGRNITNVIDPLGRRLTLTWNYNQLQTLQNVGGKVTTLSYEFQDDRIRRPIDVQTPLGTRISYAYDASGNLETITAPTAAVTTRTWLARGLIRSIVRPTGDETRTSDLGTGRPEIVYDGNGNTYLFDYDAASNCSLLVDPLNQRTTRTFAPTGQWQTGVNPLGQVTTFTRDAMNRVLARQNPAGEVYQLHL